MTCKKLALLFIFSAAFCSPRVFGQEDTILPLANGKSIFLGCAWSNNQSTGFENLWNQLTPENAGKWGSVENTRGVMNWNAMDASYNFAKKYDIPFKEHTLIWGPQQPSWIGNLDSASQRQEIEQWFSLLAARYPDIEYIDVVNEPIHNAPNGMVPWGTTVKNVDYAKSLGGAGETGWDWVITSFRLARKYFPGSKLILNEYSVINSSETTKKYIEIIKLLQADSLIDGIGEQAHAFTTYGTSASTLKANLDALGATGLPIYLTEMDIDGSTDLIQLKEMQRVFRVFWEHPAVKGITLWGFRYGLWRTDEGAFLLTQNGEERPALTWMKAYVNDTLTLTQSIKVSASDGSDSVSIKAASVNMVAKVLPENTTIPNVTWSVTPVKLAKIDSNGKLTLLAPGRISVTATAWDGSGIKGTKVIDITDQANGSSLNEFSENISLYPNPAINGTFTIDGIRKQKQIDVFDLQGRKVAGFTDLNQPDIMIKLSSPPGIYIVSISDGQKSVIKKIATR
jgi:endo-1,4-beta-xylanase